jgi:hypothetical protein
MFKKWFGRLSPFVILSVFTVFIILYQLIFAPAGVTEWRDQLLFRLLGFLVLIVVIDVSLKHFIKKTLFIWLAEIFVSLAFVYYWIVS